ncbi:hypothetical protein LY78DRAFT_594678, partial [Colletotrichum sublineola]
ARVLPKRLATDIIGALTHNIEAMYCTLVTIDIQGAFDTVNSRQLYYTLQEQGWPDNLIQ